MRAGAGPDLAQNQQPNGWFDQQLENLDQDEIDDLIEGLGFINYSDLWQVLDAGVSLNELLEVYFNIAEDQPFGRYTQNWNRNIRTASYSPDILNHAEYARGEEMQTKTDIAWATLQHFAPRVAAFNGRNSGGSRRSSKRKSKRTKRTTKRKSRKSRRRYNK
jgi:hypothetical protein